MEIIAEIGPQTTDGPMLAPYIGTSRQEGASPTLIGGLVSPGEGLESDAEGFLKAVAAVYEAGVSISFAGLVCGRGASPRRCSGLPLPAAKFLGAEKEGCGIAGVREIEPWSTKPASALPWSWGSRFVFLTAPLEWDTLICVPPR